MIARFLLPFILGAGIAAICLLFGIHYLWGAVMAVPAGILYGLIERHRCHE